MLPLLYRDNTLLRFFRRTRLLSSDKGDRFAISHAVSAEEFPLSLRRYSSGHCFQELRRAVLYRRNMRRRTRLSCTLTSLL